MGLSYGKDYQYAAQRLNQSVVMKDGLPVFIHNIDGKGLVVYEICGYHTGKQIARLEDFDLTPLQLGYINTDNKALYLQRIPHRKYRQGLAQQNLYCVGNKISVFDRALVNLVGNRYPKVSFILEELFNENIKSRAFSKKWAIGRGRDRDFYNLLYKDRLSGTVSVKDESFKLTDSHKFLKESLEEVLV